MGAFRILIFLFIVGSFSFGLPYVGYKVWEALRNRNIITRRTAPLIAYALVVLAVIIAVLVQK